MNWTKDVYAHSKQFDRQYIQRCIQNSIDITFSKMMACLIEEQTHPIQNVVKRGDHFTLYVNEDAFIEYTHTYQRIYLNANAQHIEVRDPLHLIDWLNQYNQMQYDYQLLKVEIENHLINQALSLIHCSQMPKSDHPLLQSEQYVITGHNIHPCAKTKLGLTFNEVMQYAPEYNQAFKLNWLLVKQGFLYNNLESSEIQILAKFSGYKGEIPIGYDLIPVHPYQFEHVIRNIYKEEIEHGDIIVLDHKGGLVKSTSSFRTVCPLDDMTPMIKLPVNAQMTSTIRSISNNSIINSKTIGEYFKYIYRNDERLNEISLPVLEYGGMTYIHDTENKQRNLSFILRENNTQYLTTQSQLYAATCLFEFNEHHRKVYTDLIETASMHHSPMDWFEQYISILVETTLTLMTKYGVGLEAHLQNMSFEFINGTPQRLHVRDFGGLRIDDTRIPAWLDLTNALTRATTEGMYEKVQNTLISNHLNTLVRHFSADYKYDEILLWQKIKSTFDRVFNQLQQQNIQYTEADKQAFYTETINEKALLTMRVSTEKQDIYVQRHNPLLMNDDIKV